MKKLIKLLILTIIAVTLTGCDLKLTSKTKNIGGVFKSYDFGQKWQPMNLVKKEGKKKETLNNLNVNLIKLDPQNHKLVYLASRENGLWYSDNAGSSWQNLFPKGNIYDLALDPKNSGVIYISLGRKVYKTIDLGKNWRSIYLETRGGVLITALATDPVNNLLVYLGTSNGELYKTLDGGESWQIVTQGKGAIKKILINPKNNKIIYLATSSQGIYKSSDKGETWQNLKDNYKNYNGANIYRNLIFDFTKNDALLYASNYGLLKSPDGGKNWQEIKLLTPPNSIAIRSLAINPYESNQIYYATNIAFYRTFDGGQTWLTSSLPSPRIANYLLVDPVTTNVIYMGMSQPRK